ncbi:MAG TPA: D-tyrosyl-tRNA(Tyr) deacylase [Deltaproteobacteria bacterium]|nr:D-tyrosyl-tRNA(Tyr) deacylase [Deltaproteobacteria bacterium]
MRAVVQRVSQAEIEVEGDVIARMSAGLLVLVGVGIRDEIRDALELARKLVGLRVFEDEAGRMNRSLLEVGGRLGLVSQFTLYGDVRKGRRPFFGEAAAPDRARLLFDRLRLACEASGVSVVTGRFGARMKVSLVNEGPVTILLDTQRAF